MIKLMGLLRRIDGMTRDEFHAYWRDVHAPMIVPSPGLRRYIQNHTVVPEGYPYEPAFDGMAEAWFDDLEGFDAAKASPSWQRASADVPNFMVSVGSFTGEDVPVVDARPSLSERQGLIRLIAVLRRKEGMALETFRRHLVETHGPLFRDSVPGIRRYMQSLAVLETYDDAVRPPSYDALASAWFDGPASVPWMLLQPAHDRANTLVADAASIFQQPLPFALTREVLIVDNMEGAK